MRELTWEECYYKIRLASFYTNKPLFKIKVRAVVSKIYKLLPER